MSTSKAYAEADQFSGKDINAIIIGKTGVGKSSFCNTMSNILNFLNNKLEQFPEDDTLAEVGYGIESMTVQTQHFCLKYQGSSLNIMDTPGLQDTNDKDFEHMLGVMKYISSNLKNYNCVIICVDNSRFTEQDWMSLDYIVKLFKAAFKNVQYCFIITKIGNIRKQKYEQTIKSIRELIKNRFSKILEVNECVPTVFQLFCVENLMREPDLIVKQSNMIVAKDFYDIETIQNVTELLQWLLSRKDNFLIEDESFPLPPKYDRLRLMEFDKIQHLVRSKEETIGVFDKSLKALFELLNSQRLELSRAASEIHDLQLLLESKKKDDFLAVYVQEHNKWFNFANVSDTYVVDRSFKGEIGFQFLYLHNCACLCVVDSNDAHKFSIIVKPHFVTFFSAKYKDYEGTILAAIKFTGDPVLIHEKTIKNIITSIDNKRNMLNMIANKIEVLELQDLHDKRQKQQLDEEFLKLTKDLDLYQREQFDLSTALELINKLRER